MNLYAILAWCWRLELRVWFNLLGLKLLQCLDFVFFWILRSHCSNVYKVKIFILVWVSWSHSCCFYSFRSTTKYLWKNLKNRSYRWTKAWENVQFVTKTYVQMMHRVDRWWMKNTNQPRRNMEQCGSSNPSSVLRVYAGPWANRW